MTNTHSDGAAAEIDVSALRRAAEDLARRGGQRARDLLDEIRADGRPGQPGHRVKSSRTDPVTAVDTGVEAFLRAELARTRPDDRMLGEETGDGSGPTNPGAAEGLPGGSGVRWIVDPVDGTVNLLYGIAFTAVSVAAEVDGRVVAGAVHDITSGETFSAAVGAGAHLETPGGRREVLSATDCSDPALALVGTGFAYRSQVRAEQGRVVAELLPRVRDIRRCGSAALDLCMVAAGRLDAYYERCLKPWDHAAGALIASEAGARVRVSGDDRVPTVAAAPRLAARFEAELRRAGEDVPR